jgi:serine O-acetyltransferase
MIISIGDDNLNKLVCRQFDHSFLLDKKEETVLLDSILIAKKNTEKCFQENINKYYWNDNNELLFNPYHSGQYSIFLYFLSRAVWNNGETSLADRVYCLNKMMNCCDLFYEVALPEIFYLDHPLGSIMGRASYGNYFVFQQNCTVGGNHGIFPRLGEFVRLFANATVIGDTEIGNNVFISAGVLIKDEKIPDNTIVFGKSPHLILKQRPPEYFYASSPFKFHRSKIGKNE